MKRIIAFIYGIKYKRNNVWYNGTAHSNSIKGPIIFKDGVYIPAVEGGVVQYGESKGKKVFYKITKKWEERPNADWLYPTDSIKVNLKFSHIQ